jgi:hypothetical protein
MRVDVLYFEGCPHHRAAVERTREALAEVGVSAEVREICVHDSGEAARLAFLGSPTVRVNGVDVEPGAAAHGEVGLSCRWYGGTGIPSRELLVAGIASAQRRSASTRRRIAAAFAVPAVGLAALPACPACYPLYAGILSSLGLTAFTDPGRQVVITGVLVAVALGALALRSRARRAQGPLMLGVAGAALLIGGKFLLISSIVTYTGAAGLIAATAWNAWLGGGRDPQCEACVADEGAALGPPSTTKAAQARRS